MEMASTTENAENDETESRSLVTRFSEKPVWYTLSILIIAAILYFFTAMFCWGCLTVEWAKQKKDYVTIENINFDIPWAYRPYRLDLVGGTYAFMYPFMDGYLGYSDTKNRQTEEKLNLSVMLPEFEGSKTKNQMNAVELDIPSIR